MIAFIAFSALLTIASAQYPPQGHQQSYQQPGAYQGYQPQPQSYQAPQQSYQPQPQYQQQPQPQSYQAPPQSYQAPQPQPQRTYNPAAVHYVNIGSQLAGDYKFGYDTGKGDGQSFREETRLPDGSVQGAYGYVDETGKQRVIKYTAGKNGYQVEGDGIPKAPAAPAPAAAPAQAAPAQGYNAYGGNQNYGPAGGYH
ncbi:cuticle protein 6 [Nephila pilipes]|uniref:Cuticle protein 6 n=1 Tax=Nephila pilipes TaxID=299642 RepID=A0A8X6N1K8_NEPPI|nr:cuticle protein 6 [Nephila pilipes]